MRLEKKIAKSEYEVSIRNAIPVVKLKKTLAEVLIYSQEGKLISQWSFITIILCFNQYSNIYDPVKHLGWSSFAKIGNGFQLLTIFAKMLLHRCLMES